MNRIAPSGISDIGTITSHLRSSWTKVPFTEMSGSRSVLVWEWCSTWVRCRAGQPEPMPREPIQPTTVLIQARRLGAATTLPCTDSWTSV